MLLINVPKDKELHYVSYLIHAGLDCGKRPCLTRLHYSRSGQNKQKIKSTGSTRKRLAEWKNYIIFPSAKRKCIAFYRLCWRRSTYRISSFVRQRKKNCHSRGKSRIFCAANTRWKYNSFLISGRKSSIFALRVEKSFFTPRIILVGPVS